MIRPVHPTTGQLQRCQLAPVVTAVTVVGPDAARRQMSATGDVVVPGGHIVLASETVDAIGHEPLR